MPWLLNEDAALKYKLQGLTVTDLTSGSEPGGVRQVPVRFRLPMDELVNLTFPCILIEFQQMTWASPRQHSGLIQLPYAPEGEAYPQWWPAGATEYPFAQSPYWTREPLAVWLWYQVTLYSRLQRDHQRPLEAALSQPDYLPLMDGYLNIPQDGTYRRLDITGGPNRGYARYDPGELGSSDQKRVLYTTWQARVSSEMLYDVPQGLALAQAIDFDLSCYTTINNITTAELSESFGILSVRPGIGWDVQGQ
jgi:hypothetical protein